MNGIAQSQRIALIDALRGASLFFILISNVPLDITATAAGSLLHKAETWLHALWTVLVSKKFITLFSILFGYGLYKLMDGQSKEVLRRLAIRMLVLLLIGCVHGYLLWFGDIIRTYAVCGLLLLLIAHWPTKRLWVLSMLLIIVGTGIVFIGNAAFNWQVYSYSLEVAASLPLQENWWSYLKANATIDPWVNFLQDMPLSLVFCMGNIILGFLLGRKGWLEQMAHKDLLPGWAIWALFLFGLASSVVLLLLEKGYLELSMGLIWVPFILVSGLVCQSLAYLFLFGRIARRRLDASWFGLLVAVGRMSLSNYLLQTVFYLLLFYHAISPVAWYGKFGVTITYAICFGLFAFQMWVSRWWLSRFKQGPVEYVFRRLASNLSKGAMRTARQ